MLEERKMRIMMRGVKVGKKKGGEKISVMKVFEKKAGWNKKLNFFCRS